MESDISNFNDLTDEQQAEIVAAALQGAADQWGEECMPAADIGDNRVFQMKDLIAWVLNH